MYHVASRGARVLVVDDEPLVVEAIERVLRSYGYVVSVAYSVQEALQILAQERIDVCLSDLHMPDLGGKALARQVRQQYPEIPVIIMTGDNSLETLRETLDSGAIDFITKPWRSQELPIVVERNIRRCSVRMEEQKHYLRKLNEAYSDMLEALLIALEVREREIEGHCERVTAYTMILAEAMGVPPEKHPDIERGALLHDVGKIGIPDHILFKNGPLNAAEWEIMRQHPVIGYRMCMKIRSLQNAASEVVLCHHEQWDGSGYPQGLRGEDIPIGARIFAVADALDAMTSDRPYRKALSMDQAFAEMERYAGTQFDPQVVKTFLSIPASVWEAVKQNLQAASRVCVAEETFFPLPTQQTQKKAA
ncbi:MAG: response regulator [Armatimonadota bacterium]|nr:response regulator [bacterium]MDW8319887.1 response regulator [Armatimonadota bacterium]